MFLGHAITAQQLYGQLLIGLINGSFYALLSLGLAVIFGMLNIVNFAHGALYMIGAFVAYFLLHLRRPQLLVGADPLAADRRRVRRADRAHAARAACAGSIRSTACCSTFGLALVIQGLFQNYFGASGMPYAIPPQLAGAHNLGFMFLPNYRAWVIVFSACRLLRHLVPDREDAARRLSARRDREPDAGARLRHQRAAMITLTYGFGVGLAALAGVLAAPIYQVRPGMGADIIAVVFAVVVIGGMGSILGSILTGFALGVIEGLTKVFYPEASNTVVFVIMAIVLLIRPAGLFGRTPDMSANPIVAPPRALVARSAASSPSRSSSWLAADRRRAVRRLSVLRHAGAVLRAVRLRLQSADRLRRPAVVRPRDVPRLGELRLRPRRQGLGARSGAGDPRRRRLFGDRSASSPARWRSAARASISR